MIRNHLNMAQIFNSALRIVKSLHPFMGQAVKTETEIIYSIPKVCDASKIVKVMIDDEMISIVVVRKPDEVTQSSQPHCKPHP